MLLHPLPILPAWRPLCASPSSKRWVCLLLTALPHLPCLALPRLAPPAAEQKARMKAEQQAEKERKKADKEK